MAATLDIQGNASGAEKALDNVEAGLKDVKQEAGEATKATEKLADSVEDVGGSGVTGKLTSLFTGLTAGIQIFKGLSQAAKDFRQYVREAAEEGDKAFVEFDRTLTEVTNRLVSLASQAAGSDLGQQALGQVSVMAAKAVGTMEGLVGLFVELEQKSERIAKFNRDMAQVDKVEGDLKKSRESERLQAAVNQINDLGRINKLVQDEITLLRQLAAHDKLTTEQQEKSRAKIGSLEARRRQIQAEAKAERERQLEEQIREEERAAKEIFDAQMKEHEEYEREQKRLQEEEERRLEKEKDVAERAERDKQEAITRAQEDAIRERKARIDALANKDDVKGAADQIRAAAGSDEAIIKRLAANAGAEGSEAYRQAHRKATNQARGGAQSFSEEEIAAAQKQNADAIIGSLKNTGQIGDEMVDALGQVVGATGQLEQQQAQQGQQIQSIMQVLGDTMKNARTRAQTQGRKQI